MGETRQQQTSAQGVGLPITGSRNHHADSNEANLALTFKLDHSSAADQIIEVTLSRFGRKCDNSGNHDKYG